MEETLVLDPSALEQRICVDIETVNDEAVEPIELFSVELRDPVGVVLVSPVLLQIGIVDDGDGKFTYSITNSNVYSAEIGLDFVDDDLSEMEGEPFMLCVIVTSGSNQLIGDVNVDIDIIGGTASGDFF